MCTHGYCPRLGETCDFVGLEELVELCVQVVLSEDAFLMLQPCATMCVNALKREKSTTESDQKREKSTRESDPLAPILAHARLFKDGRHLEKESNRARLEVFAHFTTAAHEFDSLAAHYRGKLHPLEYFFELLVEAHVVVEGLRSRRAVASRTN
jgi:hypothetical protein